MIKVKITFTKDEIDKIKAIQDDPRFIAACKKRIDPMVNGYILKWRVNDFKKRALEISQSN